MLALLVAAGCESGITESEPEEKDTGYFSISEYGNTPLPRFSGTDYQSVSTGKNHEDNK